MTTSCLWLALLAAQDEKPLRDFEWLAGSWTGHSRYDEKTWKFKCEIAWNQDCTTLVWRSKTLLDSVVVLEGETMLGWDSMKKEFYYTWKDETGKKITGWGRKDSKDLKTWIFDAPGQDEGQYRWVLQKMGEDSLCFVGQIRRGDAFVTLLTETLERKP